MAGKPSPSIHEILYGAPDPREPFAREAVSILSPDDAPEWREAVDAMIGAVVAILAEPENTERREDTKGRLRDIEKAAFRLIKLLDLPDVASALDIHAQRKSTEIDEVTGYEFLTQLAARAVRANKAIREGKGRDALGASLSRPSGRLLCAMCAVEALHAARGRPPSDRNPDALRLCNAIWRAAGGAEIGAAGDEHGKGEIDGAGAWARDIRAARLSGLPKIIDDSLPPAIRKQVSAIASARFTARSCLRDVQRK